MAATSSENIVNGVEKLNVSGDEEPKKSASSESVEAHKEKWGFPLEEVFKIALKFFKEKEGKALQLTYQAKLKLVALSKQATFGKFRPDLLPDVGFLDVVGNDRRQAWQALGEMSKDEAMAEFVQKMADSCNLFQPYVEAHKAEKEEAERKQKEQEEKLKQEEEEKLKKETEEAARLAQETEKKKQQEQELQIRAALNQQTQAQFRQYAEQQYPNNKTMQDELIQQLQDQHFQQYMQQVYQQQLLQQQGSGTPNGDSTGSNTVLEHVKTAASPIPDGVTPISPCGDDEEAAITSVPKIVPASLWTRKDLKEFKDGLRSSKENVVRIGSLATATVRAKMNFPLAAASMWTRKDIKEFKESLVKDKESVIKIGSGETVTVRVPTHEDGTCLFWEFATDHYDIGFGVYFEWTVSQTNTVSVHVSESSDEEDEEEEGAAKPEGGEGKAGDVEKGPGSKKAENRPPTDEIIPVYRRDCHEEVYCGSHTYPGQGVYLLKFDNSYSLWRSKTLYYRVYYSR